MASCGRWLQQLSFAVAMVFLGACERHPTKQPPPLLACFSGYTAESIPLDTIRNRQLAFDSVLYAADAQLVDFKVGRVGSGKMVRIEPESAAYKPGERELEGGCIIARIWSEAVYDSLGFGPWWTYWWVDKKGVDAKGVGGNWRSVFIPDTSSRTKRPERPMLPREHLGARGHQRWRQGISRLTAGSVVGWSVCGEYCCQSKF